MVKRRFITIGIHNFKNKREEMVRVIRERYSFNDKKVLEVMLNVPRHEFVPEKYHGIAYDDAPVDIGYGQTMSQPFTVAKMTELILANRELKNLKTKKLKNERISTNKYQCTQINNNFQFGGKRTKKLNRSKTGCGNSVLEVGAGSGYQAAILSYFFYEVYSVEIIPQLASRARTVLARLGYRNVCVLSGSGEQGWEEHAPYDVVVITAGVEEVPKGLFKQLKEGGVLVAPVGKSVDKTMTRFVKLKNLKTEKLKKEEFGTFRFVPFVKKGY